jgi:hypothetical protein
MVTNGYGGKGKGSCEGRIEISRVLINASCWLLLSLLRRCFSGLMVEPDELIRPTGVRSADDTLVSPLSICILFIACSLLLLLAKLHGSAEPPFGFARVCPCFESSSSSLTPSPVPFRCNKDFPDWITHTLPSSQQRRESNTAGDLIRISPFCHHHRSQHV